MSEEQKPNLNDALVDVLQKMHDKRQTAPDQYVVVYKLKATDTVHGYHLDSFCQTTDDILRAKRYSGTQPDEQLELIWKNLCSTLAKTQEDANQDGLEGTFSTISLKIKENCFPNLTADDLYIDAVYLTEGTPAQEMKVIVVQGGSDSTIVN